MKNFDRSIDFLFVPRFLASIETVRNPSLKEKPFVVAPLNSDTAKVWGCSKEAKKEGVHDGIELGVARKLVPRLEVVNPNPDLYRTIHRKILFKLSRHTPLCEEEGLGRIYLDFTGFDNLYGPLLDYGRKLQKSLEGSFNLSFRLGISCNKLLARAATDEFFVNENVFNVTKDVSSYFLDPFPNKILPGVSEIQKSRGRKTFNPFDELNLESVKSLKSLPLWILESLFEERGQEIFEMSRGIDKRPVISKTREESISKDSHFEDCNEYDSLLLKLYSLVDESFSELRVRSLSASSFQIGVRYTDFKFVEKKVIIPKSVQYPHEIYHEVRKSFGFIYSRRTSLRYIFFELSGLHKEESQLDLFGEEKDKKIFDLIDDINKRFPSKILRGRGCK